MIHDPCVVTPRVSIFLCHMPVDMRKSIDGLSLLVSQHFQAPPTSGALYVF